VIRLFKVFVAIALQNADAFAAAIDVAADAGAPRLDAVLRVAHKVASAGRGMVFGLTASGTNFDIVALDEDAAARLERIDGVNRNAAQGLHNVKKALVHRILTGLSKDQSDIDQQAKKDRERLKLVFDIARARPSSGTPQTHRRTRWSRFPSS
jgi:hypothetical protein